MRQVVAVFCQALWLFLLQVLKHKVISTLPREGGTLNPQSICGWYQPASEAHVTEKKRKYADTLQSVISHSE